MSANSMDTGEETMDKIVQVVKLDERSKYTTLWPLGRVEVGGRAFFWQDESEDASLEPQPVG